MSKIMNKISMITCVIIIVLLYIYIGITNSFYYHGTIIFIFLYLLLNPLLNIFRLNKKVITNLFYNFMIVIFNLFFLYIMLEPLKMGVEYYITGNVNYLNAARIYVGNYTMLLLLLLIILNIITLLFKKVTVETKKDSFNIKNLAILLSCLAPLLGEISLFMIFLIIISSILCVEGFVRYNTFPITKELQKYYFLLIILGILMCNPVAILFSILVFIEMDTIGIRI